MNKRVWMVLSVSILISIFLIYHLFQPKYLDLTYRSLIYSNDIDFAKETIVTMEGHVYKKLFSNDTFVGELIADNDLEYEITLSESDHRYFGMITISNETKQLHTIGTIITSKNFSKIWIKLDDMNQRYQIQDGYIAGPAMTLEDANLIVQEVMAGN